MLKLLLFGRPTITLQDQAVTDFVSEKALALLCYLVVRRGGHARKTLAGLLWGEMPEERALANLRTALYNLQQLIPSYLSVSRLEAAFDHQTAYWLDVEQLSDEDPRLNSAPGQPNQADLDRLTSVLQLYRGDFLEGLYPEGAPAFEEWLVVEREHLRQLAMQICHRLADLAIRLGKIPLAIQALRRLLVIEPWQESAHRQLMLTLARSGETTGALAQYAACRQVLAEGLAIEPMPETIALAERIRSARRRSRRHNLPPQPTPFVGRERELADLHRMLSQPEVRLITITGPGGIGKTRLALQVAAGLSDVFLEGVYYISLSALTSQESLAPAILDALEVPLSGTQNPRAQLREAVLNQEVLLVLDGFEHLLDGAEWLAGLLRDAPGVRLLATSRQRLSLQWEITFPVGGLEIPQDEQSESLDASSAVRLFIQSSRRVQPNFSLADEDRGSLRELCLITEGMPLALELAAAWAPSLSLGEIAEFVQHNLDLLASDLRDAPPHHRSLRAAIEKSWELLSHHERDVFRRLAVFHGGFSMDAARQVCGASAESLVALVAWSLLRQDQGGRYDLHEMLRQFAREKLEQDKDLLVTLSQEHSRYYCASLQEREQRSVGEQMAETTRELRSDLGNVRAAWRRAAQHGDLQALEQGLKCLSQFYELSGLLQEGENAFSLAVEGVRTQAKPSSPDYLRVLARLYIEQARFQRALARHTESLEMIAVALALLESDPQPAVEAAAHLQWAEILERQGDFTTASEHFERALQLAQSDEEPSLQGSSHIGLGITSGESGDLAGAVAHFKESLQISRSIGDRRGENVALHNLAIASTYQNDPLGARLYFEQELELVRSLGHRRWEVMALLGLNLLAAHYGDYNQLQAYSQQALQICQEIGERRETGTALDSLGLALLCQGRFDDASLTLGQALRTHIEVGNRRGECISRTYLSLVQRGLGYVAQAKTGLEEALSVLQELKAPLDECYLLAHLSVTQSMLDDHHAALQSARQASELARQFGDRSYEANALAGMGRAFEGLGELEEAAAALEKGREFYLQAGQGHLAWECATSLALLALAQGDVAQAKAHVEGLVVSLTEQPLQGLEPFRVYLAVYQALHAAHDQRATQVLEIAQRQLQEQAMGIQQPTQRRSFLQTPVNRDLIEAWEDL